jgi:hypothetical protein
MFHSRMVVVGAPKVVRDVMFIHLKVTSLLAFSVKEEVNRDEMICHSISSLKNSDTSFV